MGRAEQRVARRDGTPRDLVRILPQRAPDSLVQGTLATLVDVTTLLPAEAQQRLPVDELTIA